MLYRYQPEKPVFKFFPLDFKISILRHWPPKPVDKTFRGAIFVVKSDIRLQELYISYNPTSQPLSPLSMLMYATHSAYEGKKLQNQHWKRGKGVMISTCLLFWRKKASCDNSFGGQCLRGLCFDISLCLVQSTSYLHWYHIRTQEALIEHFETSTPDDIILWRHQIFQEFIKFCCYFSILMSKIVWEQKVRNKWWNKLYISISHVLCHPCPIVE